MSNLHELHFPNESAEYRAHRDELLRAEMDLRRQLETVAALRRTLPLGGKIPRDYIFDRIDPNGGALPVPLSDLFAPGKASLLLYSFMFAPEWDTPCPACTSITDGFNSIYRHVRDRVNFAVVAKAQPGKLKKLAQQREWSQLPLFSSYANSYNKDYHAQPGDNQSDQQPILNVFVKRGTDIHHFWATELLFVPGDGHPRHCDLVWPLWNLFDMTPEGRGDWGPKLAY
ncbi:DUF899 domain-containing protein [Exilibacterium tricleocarpae]|uniref:DUF899 domain-containing protein n=1 Tax=Exilibacterium tricleocarpae TaxID=2591008 RepID=A0A545SPU7_9GAMM|nr:DUF899 family protein [Exilibacterium tricleocarpae]TQV67008.1 DUF899 domain-containing protein [Exilibacterium tricleocarpae]